jgi:uncharacterized membrane-anchored protein YjiN (DUF445 family)
MSAQLPAKFPPSPEAPGVPDAQKPPPARGPGPALDEALRQAQLDQMRRRATGLLVVAAVIFVVAHVLEPTYPWLGFVRATAEASLVGGLADWFAVTALFRRPLGLPIPHTAIVATQKDRIGRILGNFVENHFLSREIVQAKLKSMQLSERAARWLSEPENSRRIAKQFAMGLAKTIDTLPEDEVRGLIQRTAEAKLQSIHIAPILGNVLTVVTTEQRRKELVDEALRLATDAVESNRELIRYKIQEQSPWWMPGRVDEAIYHKVMEGIEDFLYEIRADPRHPVRRRFHAALEEFIDKLKHSPELSARADALKADVLDQQLLGEFAETVWDAVRQAATQYAAGPDQASPDGLERGVGTVGESLLANERLLGELDDFLVTVVATVVDRHRHEVAQLIGQTVSQWDPEVAARRVELAVGRDLQYIRINGTLVGGLAGLLIYTLSRLF